MTNFQPADLHPTKSEWLLDRLADSISRKESVLALTALAKDGTGNVCVNVSLSRDHTAIEDYTCDKCREFHPSGLNVAVFAVGRDADKARDTIQNPIDLIDWAAVIINIGLCHKCFEDEGYPHSELSDVDPGFVQQAIQLIEAPPLDVLT